MSIAFINDLSMQKNFMGDTHGQRAHSLKSTMKEFDWVGVK